MAKIGTTEDTPSHEDERRATQSRSSGTRSCRSVSAV